MNREHFKCIHCGVIPNYVTEAHVRAARKRARRRPADVESMGLICFSCIQNPEAKALIAAFLQAV